MMAKLRIKHETGLMTIEAKTIEKAIEEALKLEFEEATLIEIEPHPYTGHVVVIERGEAMRIR